MRKQRKNHIRFISLLVLCGLLATMMLFAGCEAKPNTNQEVTQPTQTELTDAEAPLIQQRGRIALG